MLIPINLRPKFIKGFEGIYGVTRSGQVYSFKNGKFLLLDEWNGYLKVDLYKDKERYRKRINRLVAETYIPVPSNLKHLPVEKLTVDHINNNKKDNTVQNLQWLTRGDNLRKSRNKPVAMDNIPLIFSSQSEATQFIYGNNKRASYINKHINNKIDTLNGYKLHRCTEEELQILNEFKNWEE